MNALIEVAWFTRTFEVIDKSSDVLYEQVECEQVCIKSCTQLGNIVYEGLWNVYIHAIYTHIHTHTQRKL